MAEGEDVQCAAFSSIEVFPFLVEDELKRLRGLYEKAADWASFARTDGTLYTADLT
jgi:hypothetical protein